MTGTRAGICAAARSIFAREGVEGVSMRRVAAEVGISATAIYRHFADKQQLVNAIVEQGFEKLAAKLRLVSPTRPSKTGILRLSECYVEFALSHPQYYDFMFLLPRSNARRFPEDFAPGRSPTFDSLRDHIAMGVKNSELRNGDVSEIALTIWSHVHGFVALYRCGRFGRDKAGFRKAFSRSMKRLFEGLQA